MEHNILITLTGPSGSGKSTIEKMLVRNHKFKRAISHTSREPRMNETNGVDYYYVGHDIMVRMFNEGKLAEFIEYNGNLYGVSIKELMESQVIVIEPHGLHQVKEKMNGYKTIISFYLEVSPKEMEKRMRNRGDTEEAIQKRLKNDSKHFSIENGLYDYVINTDNYTPSEIATIIDDILEGRQPEGFVSAMGTQLKMEGID